MYGVCMKLLHHSVSPLLRIENREQCTQPQHKPQGIWVSVEGVDDWKTWCLAQRWGLDRLEHTAEIHLRQDARILRLTSAQEIDSFTADYGSINSIDGIHWQRVADQYQGIIIAPYVWSRQFYPLWYYGWDCASGCIWDAQAIDSWTCDKTVDVDSNSFVFTSCDA
jgi:hypothetical protein